MGNTLGLAPMGALPRRSPRREEPLPNPGSFDELHRLCKDVFPAQMEGVKLVVNKVLSSHFQVAHTVHMSALGLPGYHLHAAYAGDWQLSPTEVFPTVVGDMDSSGSLNAQVLLLLAERLRAKAVFQTQQAKFLTWQFDGEYRGDDYTATLTLGNPDLIGESVIVVAHFLQSLTHRLVLGGELVYHRRPGEEGAILTLAGKYSAQHWVATLNVGSGGAHASYYHRANEQVQVGVEFEANTRLQDTTFSFGYHLTLPQANMVFRGLVDSNWCVGAVLEKKMPPLPVTLALGAFLNHWRNRGLRAKCEESPRCGQDVTCVESVDRVF
ncbi:mitochondrial import receptor subunit TOM40B isoform X1 [Leopardus geoffroyi]|uniref:mitochondrial import receptor subunit TOM40B isoform X1 n=1 Tax=Leopardus geoffroyi TaxID=46844 RepID=UPI001E2664A3|nr:mitochondrial import receptor subunit TOM40B isoform X1 [Leopardus geoffroyi]XP_045311254.1 mitochondrial import receptor subunit TOM40B isoform X1 [Leopardus geoffroyi]